MVVVNQVCNGVFACIYVFLAKWQSGWSREEDVNSEYV